MLPKVTTDKRYGWPQDTIKDIQERFNITHPILLINKYNNFSDLFIFEFKLKNIYEIFFNHYDIIENFILYFKDRANQLIKKASHDPLMIVNHEICEPSAFNQIFSSKEIINTIQPRNFYLYYQDREIHLKYKYYQVFYYISLGLDNKNIADKMCLSSRTIEDYINTLIKLFSVKKKSDLISLYRQIKKNETLFSSI